MMRVFDLAMKDVRQVLRDRRSLIFMLAMPIVFTLFFGFAFNQNAAPGDNRLPVGLRSEDGDGALAAALVDMIGGSQTVRPVMLTADETADLAALDARVVSGELVAVLVIPRGFSESALSSAPLGDGQMLRLTINEETTAGQTVRRALQTAITRTMGIAEAAKNSLAIYEQQQKSPLSATERAAFLADGVARAAAHWKENRLSVVAISGTEGAGAETAADGQAGGNIYNQFSPGMIIQFAFFGLMQAAMVLVSERKNGAMARLLTTPMRRSELIAGHTLGMFLIFFLQQFILVAFGQFVLKVDYFREPLGTLLIMSALALWVASTGLLVAALVKKEDQVVLFTMVAMFVFAGLGGAWFSLEMVGGAFATVGHLMPSAWVMTGYQNIIMRGLGLSSVLLPAAIVLAYAVAFMGISIWRFRTE